MDPPLVLNHLNDIRPIFDIDGNGQVDAFTDGVLLLRYLFGLRGPALIAGTSAPGATRISPMAIESYIQSIMP